jgi:hypothetical protein
MIVNVRIVLLSPAALSLIAWKIVWNAFSRSCLLSIIKELSFSFTHALRGECDLQRIDVGKARERSDCGFELFTNPHLVCAVEVIVSNICLRLDSCMTGYPPDRVVFAGTVPCGHVLF